MKDEAAKVIAASPMTDTIKRELKTITNAITANTETVAMSLR
ncbi:hypothetical protein FACS1894109_12860 [Spirochaetia bacterium]|nr:hypothetical protein FACS1894109_12860 [Spirochaetia bacterium]